MGDPLMLQKDDAEHPVPEHLRSTFHQIADALVDGDFQLKRHPTARVRPVSKDTAQGIAGNISAYGETLAPLSDKTWERSVYLWMDGHWQVVVDLTTTAEPVSDLALHANTYEAGDDLEVELYGVYVP
jgi:hypothetical protein